MLKKIFEFYFKYYGLFELNLDKYKSNFDVFLLDEKFEFKVLTSEDFIFFENLDLPNEYLNICRQRLSDSNFKCFALLEQSNLAYYSWINFTEKYYVKEINKLVRLSSKKKVLFEDDNTMEDYRKMGLHNYMMNRRIEYCISNKIDAILIVIFMKNIPALRTVRKFSFRRINLFPIYYRKGSFSYTFLKFFKR